MTEMPKLSFAFRHAGVADFLMRPPRPRRPGRPRLRTLVLAASAVGIGLAAGLLRAQTAAPSGPAEVFVQTGNSLMVTMVRFSPDGQRVATCDGRGQVLGWDATSGRQYRELHKHTGTCLGLAFTPDGQGVVSTGGAASGNEAVLSRWTDGAELQRWEGYQGQFLGAATTRDGQGVWTLGDRGVLQRWTAGAATPAQTVSLLLPGEDAASAPNNAAMAITADAARAFVGRRDGSIVTVSLTGTGPAALVARLPEAVSSLALSPDGRLLAAARGTIMGSSGKEIVLIDTVSGQTLRRLEGHEGNVFALAFSPDGQLLASAAQIDMQAMLNGPFSALRQHEMLRLWRVQDGTVVATARNQRNLNGVPFLRGSLDFAPATPGQAGPLRLALALWDEAARLYELDGAQALRLVATLEGRGLAPRQLKASDAAGRLLVSDGRPRVEPNDTYLQAADVRREFGRPADWTEARSQRVDTLYTARGFRSKVQKASLWNLRTGRLEQVVDWQRGPTSELGLDAQGRFTSVAPLFPNTILVAPLKTRIVREATTDADGQVTLRHFGYEPWDGRPDDIFDTSAGTAGAGTGAAAPPRAEAPGSRPPHAGSYGTDVISQSPSQRWTAVAGVPIQDKKDAATSGLSPRVFVQERLADGSQVARHDIALSGVVLAMAMSADDRTLWISGTASGLPYDGAHVGWLAAVDLAAGAITRQWPLAEGVTVDHIAAHPAGEMAITNGGTNLSVWDRRQAARRFFVPVSPTLRPVRALGLSDDGRAVAAADTTGHTVLFDWKPESEPAPVWTRQLAAPSPHLLGFFAGNRRVAAGASDGSVRLLDAKDGSEVARMIRFDNEEWITIIPEGYFVSSQDGDRWVNVRREGRVYGIDQFYDVFYRPDIVERRLAGEPIAPLITVTLDDALRQPPPAVALALPPGTPPTAGSRYRLSLEALTQGGGVGEVRVLHNGKLVEVLNRAVVTTGLAQRPGAQAAAATSSPSQAAAPANAPVLSAQPQSAESGAQAVTRALRLAVQGQQGAAARPVTPQVRGEVEVELVPGENAFTVIGFNGAGTLNARPLTRAINVTGTAPAPRIFVLAVGVDRFANASMAPPLSFAVKDSGDFAAALRSRLGSAWRDAPIVLRTLHNEQATRAGLTAALEQLQREVRSNDLLVWFVASHGTLDDNAQYGIVLHDWDGRPSEASLFSTARILDASRQIKAFNQFVVLDTCHAGGLSSVVRGLYDARLAVLARNMGLHVFASASATEEAIDGYQGNGLFTHALLKGLNTGAADRNGDKAVTIKELGDYARRETMRIARALRHSQEPLLMNFGKDVTVYAID
jgi:WD40 repeat protein